MCPECGKELEKWSLVTHFQTQNGLAKGGLGSEGDKADGGGDKQRTYRMVFTTREVPRPCPVEGLSGRASTQASMRVHFWHWHIRDTGVILEEGDIPYPRRPLCGMLVPWKALNGTHRRTSQ